MLAEYTKRDIKEVIGILKELDSIGMTIIISNATALLARQELLKDKAEQPELMAK